LCAEPPDSGYEVGRAQAIFIAGQDEVCDRANGLAILPGVRHDIVKAEYVRQQKLKDQPLCRFGRMARNSVSSGGNPASDANTMLVSYVQRECQSTKIAFQLTDRADHRTREPIHLFQLEQAI
jgi:hypothetical protein